MAQEGEQVNDFFTSTFDDWIGVLKHSRCLAGHSRKQVLGT